MHCNLRPPESRKSFPALITTPCQVWCRWTYPLPYYSVFAADALFYAATLTSDLEHLQCIVCDVVKLCTKFESGYFFPTARLPRWFDQPIQSVSFAAIIHTEASVSSAARLGHCCSSFLCCCSETLKLYSLELSNCSIR